MRSWGQMYTVSQKTSHLAIIFTYTIRLWSFLAEVILRKWKIRWCFVFTPHLSSVSALPCEIGNPEDSALVHCACSTVQLLQRYRVPFSWTMPPVVPISEHIDYKTYGVIQQRECESWVKKIEKIKQLVEFKQCTNTAFEGKMQFLLFPVLPGSAEAHVIWRGIVKCLLIAYFVGNISPKNITRSSAIAEGPRDAGVPVEIW